MKKRVIDEIKCFGCGLCVNDCINGYLQLEKKEGGKYTAVFKERGRCLECGHCNAICPNGAVDGGDIIPDIDVKDEGMLLSLMCHKRTVRSYVKDKEIPKMVIEKIILAAESAPTDRNRKSAKIIFVKDKLPDVYNDAIMYLVDKVQKNGRIDPLYVPVMKLYANKNEILWNAEYLVVFIGLQEKVLDAVIAAERMQLVAESLGVASAYRGDMVEAINGSSSLRNLLNIKKNEKALISFAMGYTDTKYIRTAVKKKKEIEFM